MRAAPLYLFIFFYFHAVFGTNFAKEEVGARLWEFWIRHWKKYLICWRLYDSTECFSSLPQVMQKPGYSLLSYMQWNAMENPGFPIGGCQQQSKGLNTPSVKRQRQVKCQTLGMDLGPILERHHRLTLAA